jgi:arginine N-succinyltransferase
MFVLRDAVRSDEKELGRLAAVLDTVNLPDDGPALAELLDRSIRSFAGKIRDPFERSYLFVLEDVKTGRLVGTSQIIAQHGTRDAPHIYLDVFEREHYSQLLDRHFRHAVMQIGYNYEGHTEIGGLVVHPDFRGIDKPGKQLSWGRFLYLAMHRARFRDRVLAELLPPLLPDGRSLLWEGFGRRFTGLDYQEADKLSRRSKEFIKELFPSGEIYCELLDAKVQKIIGKVGPETEGVRKMLESIGFAYDHRIDPFDGGPHYSAATDDIRLVREYRRAKVMPERLERAWEERFVAIERPTGKQKFRACRTPCRIDDDKAYLPLRAWQVLGLEPGDRVHTIPFDESGRSI